MRKPCKFAGCKNLSHRVGYCSAHERQLARGINLTPITEPKDVLGWLEDHSVSDSDQCLIWPFARNKGGYGNLFFNGRYTNAHRMMCELSKGPPPFAKADAAHSCLNGRNGCVNPNHLSWKTRKDNEKDKIVHGTKLLGEALAWSRLTESQVVAIREFSHTCSRLTVSRLFDITPGHAKKIINREIWKHI